jgi:hypothetical protein
MARTAEVRGIEAAARRGGSRVTLAESVRGSADDRDVPRISAFYGIVIAMYRDHAPPHFHAVYGEYEATIVIATISVLSGDSPGRALRLVQEWAQLHQAELEANWHAARARVRLASIEPLP